MRLRCFEVGYKNPVSDPRADGQCSVRFESAVFGMKLDATKPESKASMPCSGIVSVVSSSTFILRCV